MLSGNALGATFLLLLSSSPLAMCKKACSGSATYTMAFQGEWGETGRPQGAHFSGLVGCSHNHCYQMFKKGEKASLGVKNVAEKGKKCLIISKLCVLI